MFTGIIEQVGTVSALRRQGDSAELWVHAPDLLVDTATGDSIAVNGVCLTVTALQGGSFRTTAVEETMKRTTLGELTVGSRVNLERAMQPTGRFGGHLVNGHIDGVGIVTRLHRRRHSIIPFIECAPALCRYLVEKGWIAVDGVSLTVIQATDRGFSVSLIPHTREVTTLGDLAVGSRVNLEMDILAKYVERLLQGRRAEPETTQPGRITAEFLKEHGVE